MKCLELVNQLAKVKLGRGQEMRVKEWNKNRRTPYKKGRSALCNKKSPILVIGSFCNESCGNNDGSCISKGEKRRRLVVAQFGDRWLVCCRCWKSKIWEGGSVIFPWLLLLATSRFAHAASRWKTSVWLSKDRRISCVANGVSGGLLAGRKSVGLGGQGQRMQAGRGLEKRLAVPFGGVSFALSRLEERWIGI